MNKFVHPVNLLFDEYLLEDVFKLNDFVRNFAKKKAIK